MKKPPKLPNANSTSTSRNDLTGGDCMKLKTRNAVAGYLLALPFLLGGAGGGLLCGLFYHKISPRLLQKVFALLMLYGGVRSLLG